MRSLLIFSVFLAACSANSPTAERTRHVPVVERGLAYSNGLTAINGVQAVNGLALSNGLAYSNGLMYSNGLVEFDGQTYGHRQIGLNVDRPLNTADGLSVQYGYVTHPVGRQFIRYLVECALGPNDYLVKGEHVFVGRVGLAPQWKINACDAQCQSWVTACLLARTNAQGASVNIELRAAHPAIGLGVANAAYSAHEGAFFGNVFGPSPMAYACQGPGLNQAVAQNRLCTAGHCAGITVANYRTCSSYCGNDQGSITWCPTSASDGAPVYPAISTWVQP